MIVEVHDLWKRYGRFDALQGLEFGVPEGSAFALIGPNGAGKTTTIKILVNLLEPSRGNAAILGVDSRAISPRELADIGYVSENQDLPGRVTVGEYLATGALLVGLCAAFLPWRTTWLLEQALTANTGADHGIAIAFGPSAGRFRPAPGQGIDDVLEKPGVGPVDVAAENQRRRAEGAVTVFLPVRVSGLVPDSRLLADRSEVTVVTRDGQTVYRGTGNDLELAQQRRMRRSIRASECPARCIAASRLNRSICNLIIRSRSSWRTRRTPFLRGVAISGCPGLDGAPPK